MRQSIGFLVMAALGALVGAFATHSFDQRLATRPSASPDSAAALAGIAALHRADSVATIAGIATQLRELWDSQAVRIVPREPPTVTRAAIYKEDSASLAAFPQRHIVRYVPHYHAPLISGNSAVEWGTFDATYATASGSKSDSVSVRGNALRVLQRQRDGSWKFSHVMINSAR